MRSSTKSELQMLRELVWLHIGSSEVDILTKLCGWKFCYFCHEPLLRRPKGMTFGHSHHPPVPTSITQHHLDGDRNNNDPSNLRDCHESCHRSHHAKKRALIAKTRREEVTRRYEETQKDAQGEKETQVLITDIKGDVE